MAVVYGNSTIALRPLSCCRLDGSDSLSVQRRGTSDLFGESIPNCYGNISILVASART